MQDLPGDHGHYPQDDSVCYRQGIEIAFAEIEGWDTHVAEGGATGQLANRLKELGDGLAAFYQDLGDRMEDVALVTMSEFGRTARENRRGRYSDQPGNHQGRSRRGHLLRPRTTLPTLQSIHGAADRQECRRSLGQSGG